MTADAELGYVYLPTEAPLADTWGGERHGNNLYSSSLVCLDAKTGERVWHYQLIHHDIWDWDNPTAPILMDLVVDGRPIKAVAQLTKQAFVYTFDRVTGEPVWPIEERPVPQTDVPGEWTSPTQPFPTKPPPYDRQGVSIDDLIDFTPALRAEAVEGVKAFRIGPIFTPPSLAKAPDGTRRHADVAARDRRRELGRRRVRSRDQRALRRLVHESVHSRARAAARRVRHHVHQRRRRPVAVAARACR